MIDTRHSVWEQNTEIKSSTEHNIILLTFLVAHQGLNTVRRAFPGVRVVTAAIDPILTERAFPMDEHTVVGSAAGDGDFATRITPLPPIFAQDGGESIQALEARLDRLRFSRPSQVSTPAEGRQKRAWVIEPGERDRLHTKRNAAADSLVAGIPQGWATSGTDTI